MVGRRHRILLILLVGFIEAGVLPYNKYGGDSYGAKGYGAVYQPCGYRRQSYAPCGYMPYRRPRTIKRTRCCRRRGRVAQPCISVVQKTPFIPYVPKMPKYDPKPFIPYVPKEPKFDPKPFVPPFVPPPPPAPIVKPLPSPEPVIDPCPVVDPLPAPAPIVDPLPAPAPEPCDEPIVFKGKSVSAHASASASFSSC